VTNASHNSTASAPTGAEAVELWDAFVTLGRFDGLYELKRTREVGPILGPRPVLNAG